MHTETDSKKQSTKGKSSESRELKKKLTVRQFIRNDHDFISYFKTIKLWQSKVHLINFLAENKIIDFSKSNHEVHFDLKLIYETGETVILVTSLSTDSANCTATESLFVLKLAPFSESSSRRKKRSRRRVSQVNFLFMKKSERVLTHFAMISRKVYDLKAEANHLRPEYENKLMVFDKDTLVVFTSSEILFLDPDLAR